MFTSLQEELLIKATPYNSGGIFASSSRMLEMRNRGRGGNESSEALMAPEAEVLDSDEQTAIVDQLKQQSTTQATRTRQGFTLICLFCAASMLYCAYVYLSGTSSLHHQTRFEPVLSAAVLMGYYVSSCASYVIAAKICLVSPLHFYPCSSCSSLTAACVPL